MITVRHNKVYDNNDVLMNFMYVEPVSEKISLTRQTLIIDYTKIINT